MSALAPRAFPGAPRECGVPTPPCSALRLLSSPAHSRACPFAHLQWQGPPRFIDASATSRASIKEPSPSRGLTTRPLRASPRHPWLSLRRRRMSSCGAETDLLFTGHSAVDASDTSVRRAWSERLPASPKGRIETEPRGPSQLRGVRGVARIAPAQLRIVTIRHGLKVFRSHFALFW